MSHFPTPATFARAVFLIALLMISTAARADFYADLGVAKDATEDEIKQAYRKLAMKYHPDRNPGDQATSAEAKFKAVKEAFDTLGDETKRLAYDRLRDPKMMARKDLLAFAQKPVAEGGHGFARVQAEVYAVGMLEKMPPEEVHGYIERFEYGYEFGHRTLEEGGLGLTSEQASARARELNDLFKTTDKLKEFEEKYAEVIANLHGTAKEISLAEDTLTSVAQRLAFMPENDLSKLQQTMPTVKTTLQKFASPIERGGFAMASDQALGAALWAVSNFPEQNLAGALELRRKLYLDAYALQRGSSLTVAESAEMFKLALQDPARFERDFPKFRAKAEAPPTSTCQKAFAAFKKVVPFLKN